MYTGVASDAEEVMHAELQEEVKREQVANRDREIQETKRRVAQAESDRSLFEAVRDAEIAVAIMHEGIPPVPPEPILPYIAPIVTPPPHPLCSRRAEHICNALCVIITFTIMVMVLLLLVYSRGFKDGHLARAP